MKIDMTLTGCEELEKFLRGRLAELRPKCERAMNLVGTRWVYEAKLRVPVDNGLLRNTIIKDAGFDFQGPYCQVGSNQKYAKYTEFGTQHIAGGAVEALGTGDEITDLQAVHSWPAKDGDATRKTSAMIDTAGGAKGRRRNSLGQFLRGRPQEQMPWLRPALAAIKHWIIGKLAEVIMFEK